MVHRKTSRRPMYKVETDGGTYVFVFGRIRAMVLKKNLERGNVFNIQKTKKVSMKKVERPTENQVLEAKINTILKG